MGAVWPGADCLLSGFYVAKQTLSTGPRFGSVSPKRTCTMVLKSDQGFFPYRRAVTTNASWGDSNATWLRSEDRALVNEVVIASIMIFRRSSSKLSTNAAMGVARIWSRTYSSRGREPNNLPYRLEHDIPKARRNQQPMYLLNVGKGTFRSLY